MQLELAGLTSLPALRHNLFKKRECVVLCCLMFFVGHLCQVQPNPQPNVYDLLCKIRLFLKVPSVTPLIVDLIDVRALHTKGDTNKQRKFANNSQVNFLTFIYAHQG